jgi:hypothetical protein
MVGALQSTGDEGPVKFTTCTDDDVGVVVGGVVTVVGEGAVVVVVAALVVVVVGGFVVGAGGVTFLSLLHAPRITTSTATAANNRIGRC